MLQEDFTNTLDFWIQALDQYSIAQLYTKPSPADWSVGQLYQHLIDDTNFYIQQIKICLSANDYRNGEASSFAKALFLANTFPDEAIAGALSHAQIPQPKNKEQLADALLKIREEMMSLQPAITSASIGKSAHPGLGYFTAREWLQFAEMHLRHHLQQKTRIDIFLQSKHIGYL